MGGYNGWVENTLKETNVQKPRGDVIFSKWCSGVVYIAIR